MSLPMAGLWSCGASIVAATGAVAKVESQVARSYHKSIVSP